MASYPVAADDNARGAYDQVLIDVTAYVFHHKIESPRAWQCAKAALLDSLGCVLETLNKSREARAIIGPVVPGTVVPNGFRLPGTSYQMDPLKGSFDLGSLIRYLDHNDAFPGAEWGHPSGERGSDGDSICTQFNLCTRQHRCDLSCGRLAESHVASPR